jgi:hypothetical protein
MDWEQPEAVLDRVAQLGEPTAQFAVGKTRLVRNLVMAVFLILVGAGILVFTFFVGLRHIHVLWKLVVWGPVALVGGVMLVVRAYRNLGLWVVVFPEGVVRVCHDDMQAFFFEEISKLWQKTNFLNWNYAWQGALVFTAQRADGTEISFDDSLPGLKELGQILKRETLPYLLPKSLEAYDAGRTLDFGKVRISVGGLAQGAESLPWREVKSIVLDDSQLTVYKKNKWGHWLHVAGSEIPNFHVLQQLLDQRSPVKPTMK